MSTTPLAVGIHGTITTNGVTTTFSFPIHERPSITSTDPSMATQESLEVNGVVNPALFGVEIPKNELNSDFDKLSICVLQAKALSDKIMTVSVEKDRTEARIRDAKSNSINTGTAKGGEKNKSQGKRRKIDDVNQEEKNGNTSGMGNDDENDDDDGGDDNNDDNVDDDETMKDDEVQGKGEDDTTNDGRPTKKLKQ